MREADYLAFVDALGRQRDQIRELSACIPRAITATDKASRCIWTVEEADAYIRSGIEPNAHQDVAEAHQATSSAALEPSTAKPSSS